ncbi:MAG TPA: hypothetical protein VE621_09530 [Bryobacteraceae bacterium]|nr:hypothetical protein [Bryobacteraceae bacterium]
MIENFRLFQAGPDPFGRTFQVEFRWQQNAISIRHSDSVDVKFELSHGEDVEEKVIALMHPVLLRLSAHMNRPLTDAWCLKLAALHLKYMIETDTDMDKVLVTPSYEDLERAAVALVESASISTP